MQNPLPDARMIPFNVGMQGMVEGPNGWGDAAAGSVAAGRQNTAPQEAEPEPRVIVCAWCGTYGRAQAAMRPPDRRVWEPVSHAFAQAAKRAHLASHGICPACREREQRKIDDAPAGPEFQR